LKKFGEIFFDQTKNLIDKAMIEENNIEKFIYRSYNYILNENDQSDSNNNEFIDFKEMVTELLAHANEYNLINSKFFGRDSLMSKVFFNL
jgi:hypothetical protein